MGIVYEANVAHKDWGGTASANDRWRKDAYGWEYSRDRGATWGRAFYNWDNKVISGALVSINAPHTDADLAMALELAEMASHNDYDFRHDDAEVAHWLRAEVIRELRERGGAQ